MSKSKYISLFISGFYLIAFICLSSRNHGLKDVVYGIGILLLCLSMPLGCIWFKDSISAVFDRGRNPELNPDWGIFVSFAGWILLMVPAIMVIIRITE